MDSVTSMDKENLTVTIMDKENLIEGLNADLNSELEAVMRYLLEASVVRGFGGTEARELFQKEIPDELRHAAFLADKIAALGGTPDIEPAYPTPITDPGDALKREHEIERKAIETYKERARQAEVYGDIGLVVMLENFIADETRHAEELERQLWNRPARRDLPDHNRNGSSG